MRGFLFFIAFTFSFAHADTAKKVLFNCKSGEYKSFEKMLDSIEHISKHYAKKGEATDIAVVAQGECVKFVILDTIDTEYEREEIPMEIELKMENLKGKARFEQCAVTLDRKSIPKSKLKKGVAVIPSATVSVIEYQHNGYALVP